MPSHPLRSVFPVLTAACAALFFSGCATYTERTAQRDADYRSGNMAAAVSKVNADADKNADNKDTILYRLEQGAILRAAALSASDPASIRDYLIQSNQAFDAAENRVNRYEDEARIKIGSETGALLTNQANTPYRGRAYDKVMLNTYKALNHLQLGERDAARVELNRAFQRQRDAVDENARRIEQTQAAAAKAKAGQTPDDKGRTGQSYDVDRAQADPRTSSGLQRIANSTSSAADAQPYSDYVNPFSVLLDGLYFANCSTGSADFERARVSFKRVTEMAPGNPYVKEDLAEADAARSPAGITYVLFETGSGPWRDQVRIDLPIFIVTNAVSYVGAAFPSLQYNPAHITSVSVSDGAKNNVQASLLCSMDSVVARDFRNEWPSIVTKTLISTGIKATMDAIIQKQARDQFGDTGQVLTQLFTFVTQAAINIADTRTWRSLPKSFYYARLPTPEDRVIGVTIGNQIHRVALTPGDTNIVYIKSIAPGAPPAISQFPLK